MEPIINPWIIYATSVIGNVRGLSMVGIIICVGVLTFVGLVYTLNLDADEKSVRRSKKVAKYATVVLLIFVVLALTLPDRETLATMIALQYITPDNVQLVQGNIVDFVSEIMQAISKSSIK